MDFATKLFECFLYHFNIAPLIGAGCGDENELWLLFSRKSNNLLVDMEIIFQAATPNGDDFLLNLSEDEATLGNSSSTLRITAYDSEGSIKLLISKVNAKLQTGIQGFPSIYNIFF